MKTKKKKHKSAYKPAEKEHKFRKEAKVTKPSDVRRFRRAIAASWENHWKERHAKIREKLEARVQTLMLEHNITGTNNAEYHRLAAVNILLGKQSPYM